MNTTKIVKPGDTIVIGHKNPDTDTICSAIGYAVLKNEIKPQYNHVACRAGELNAETQFVFRHFGVPVPPLIEDVSPQVQDVEIRRTGAFTADMTVRDAWEDMRDIDISTLAVTNPDGTLYGIITLRDLAVSHMDSMDTEALTNAKTPIGNIARTLGGTVLLGDENERLKPGGHIVIGAGDPTAIKENVKKGDVVLVSNRPESQYWAVKNGASCVVVCLGAEVGEKTMALARENGCALISTKYDTFTASYFINQSVPIDYYLLKENIRTFNLWTPLEDAIAIMSKTRYVYFPVLDNEGKLYGVVSRRNVLNLHRKKVILVDHNERQQAVHGCEEAEIVEIIDHHRVGGLQTGMPIYFRNPPVGCTATIVWEMYKERDVEIPKVIAGLLCCAVLSDTLRFRSPTCTQKDIEAAYDLAYIAGEDIEALADAMFAAGEDITGKTGQEIINQDFKVFTTNGVNFCIGQANFLSKENMKKAARLVKPALSAVMKENACDMIFFMLTDIKEQESTVLYAGSGAESIITTAFNAKAKNDRVVLKNVMSRKKQLVPPIVEALRSR